MKSILMKDFEDWVNCMYILIICNIVWWYCFFYCSNFLWFSLVLLFVVGFVVYILIFLFILWIFGDGSVIFVIELMSVSVNCVIIGVIFCFLNFVFKL